jgi:multidrug efflux pump
VVTLEETTTAPVLPHYERLPTATVSGYMTSEGTLGSILEEVRAIAEDVIPQGGSYRFSFAGMSERFYESEHALAFAYALAVLIVYLVLAAQFESFIHPATILVAVALSFTGALLTLKLTENTLNLFSQIGLVMLVGLVTKNAILIVEFSNQLRNRGLPAEKAVLEAARTRFRPVLMTALSTIAGIMPIAIGFGAGGEARAPLGIAVAGGMLCSTMLTFFVVPVVYLQFERLQIRITGKTDTDSKPFTSGAPEGSPVALQAQSREH